MFTVGRCKPYSVSITFIGCRKIPAVCPELVTNCVCITVVTTVTNPATARDYRSAIYKHHRVVDVKYSRVSGRRCRRDIISCCQIVITRFRPKAINIKSKSRGRSYNTVFKKDRKSIIIFCNTINGSCKNSCR